MEFVIAYTCPIGRQSYLTRDKNDAVRVLRLTKSRGYTDITCNGIPVPA